MSTPGGTSFGLPPPGRSEGLRHCLPGPGAGRVSATPHTGLGCLGELEEGCRTPRRQRRVMLWGAVGTTRIDSRDRAPLPG